MVNGKAASGAVEYGEDLPAPAIAREGWPIVVAFVIGSAVLTGGATFLGRWLGGANGGAAGALVGMVVGFVCVLLTLWCVWFFRDPKRRVPVSRAGVPLIVSPADGVVCFVGPSVPPVELGVSEHESRGLTRVSVFMNVFNVHVNRSPAAAVVEKTNYRPGKFFNASLDKASAENERLSLLLRLNDGRALVCVQIAGLIARRIVCRVGEGTRLMTGERYGLIRFGSRVDVYLPRGVEPMVKTGDRSVAGETVFGVLSPVEQMQVRVADAGRAGKPVETG